MKKAPDDNVQPRRSKAAKSSRRKGASRGLETGSKNNRMVQDYVKTIYSATEWGKGAFSVSGLAEHMGVAVSTASENIRRLSQLGLLSHEPYRGITLTKEGEELALEMVRKHRLIETYLYEKLNFRWDEVHEEAEILEHAVSSRLIDHIDEALDFPTSDPHGDSIPGKDGTYEYVESQMIGQSETGKTVKVVRIDDDSPQLLRFLDNVGIRPGIEVTPQSYMPHVGVLNVEIDDRQVALGQPAIEAIWVTSDTAN